MLNRNSQVHTACYKRGVFLYFKYLIDEWFKKIIIIAIVRKEGYLLSLSHFAISFATGTHCPKELSSFFHLFNKSTNKNAKAKSPEADEESLDPNVSVLIPTTLYCNIFL